MHLIIDGYNLLHVGHSTESRTANDLQRMRDRLLDQLATYRQTRPCDVTIVFDGWQGGWATEKQEKRRGIELIFSRLGEKADEVVKRLARQRGSGAIVITSDREVARYAERAGAAVIPSDQFRQRMVRFPQEGEGDAGSNEGQASRHEKKGPSKRLSKKEKRRRSALRKL